MAAIRSKALPLSILTLAVWFSLGSFLAPASATEISRVTTPAGFKTWFVREETIPIITVTLSFDGGSALDPAGLEGLANFVSGTLDEGAGDLPSLAYQKRLQELAISISFNAYKDRFRVRLRTLTKNRDEAFRLLGLVLQRPRFDEKAIERVRVQILTNIENEAEDANSIAAKAWFRKIYPSHVYGRPSNGTKESVAAITPDDLRGFVRRRFARDNVLIGAVGNIDSDELSRQLDSALAGLPAASHPVDVAEIAPVSEGSLTVIRKPNPQSVVIFGMPGIKRDDADFYAGYVMNYILGGGGFTSRLYQEVREKRGLAYSVYSYLAPLEHAGLYMGGVATRNDGVAEVLDIIRAEIARLAEHNISAEELAMAKQYLTGAFPLRLDTSGKVARILVQMQFEDLGIDYLVRRNGYIEAVTLDDTARAARRLLDPERMRVVVVGDPENLAADGP